MDRTEQVLKAVTEAFGPPGFEDDIRERVKKEFERADAVHTDRLGSLVAEVRGTQEHPRLMFVAHMDEVGLIVKSITEDGYLRFEPLGGWRAEMLLGQRVIVRTRKGDFPGVIGSVPPHLLRGEEAKKTLELRDLWIDLGVEKGMDVKETLGVRVGDPVVPYSEFTISGNPKVYIAKAFDNRVSVGLLIRILDELKARAKDHPNTVYLTASVQEEVGLRGARTSAWVVEPDVAIALDVSIAEDTPGLKERGEARLGGGASIVVQDRTMVAHRRLRDFLIALAEERNIPYNLVTVQGGYDTGVIHLHKQGVPSAIIGVPSRYIHGFHSMIHRDDFDAALNLCLAVIEELTPERVEEFTRY